MAIELIKGPIGYNEMPGPLTPPSDFDRKKWASKWVKEGRDVEAAANREFLLGTRYTADGWEVWKTKDGRPYVIPLSSGKYVLLYRSKAVQDSVNAIYGNVGKQRLVEERQRVKTTAPEDAGLNPNDTGVLDDEILKRQEKSEWGGEGDVKLNEIPVLSGSGRVEKPSLRTGSRKKS